MMYKLYTINKMKKKKDEKKIGDIFWNITYTKRKRKNRSLDNITNK